MGEYQQILKLKTLDSVNSIVKQLSQFLTYRTPIRNAAYLIQLDNYLSQLPLEKGLKTVHEFNLLRIRADIIEILLYCALQDTNKLAKVSNNRKPGLKQLSDKAKQCGLVSKLTYKKISAIRSNRNYLHPSKQIILFTQMDQKIFKNSNEIVKEVMKELRQNAQ